MRINTVDPGYTATDFNNHSGHQTVEEGAEAIVKLAQIGPDGPTGTYVGPPRRRAVVKPKEGQALFRFGGLARPARPRLAGRTR